MERGNRGAADAASTHNVDSSFRRQRQTCRVLVVEDDEASREFLAEFLRLEGYSVRIAVDGAEALGVAQTFHPDVVCTDICMPGVGGVELCQNLQEDPLTSGVTVLAMTALSRDAWEDFAEVGFAEIFAKPLELEVLSARIEQVSGQRTVDPTLHRGGP